MGKPCFSKAVKFFAFALLGAATAIIAIAVLSTPAAAHSHNDDGGGDSDDYPWDTDNLRYGNYNAKSFNIPFHKYSGYSGVAACQSGVADGFFQSGDSSKRNVPEDFPVLVFAGGAWGVEAETSTANNSGCDEFVAQQERLRTQVNSGLGYALDSAGNLHVFTGGAAADAFAEPRTSADLSYVAWGSKATAQYATRNGGYKATSDSRYLNRADGHTSGRRYPRAISPNTAGWTAPANTSSNGVFSHPVWHGTSSLVSPGVYGFVVAHSNGNPANHLTKAKSEDLCRSGFHPRGEDSSDRIAGGTGRSLTGLSHANGQIADRFWCRSDLRYLRSFKAEHHTSLGQNVIRHADAVAAGSVFTAYGRLNCYYTSTARTTLDNGGDVCEYYYPLPQCTDNGTKREFTKAELDNGYTTGAAFTAADDGTTDCADSTPADPPQQAGFTADACVTASLEIYENRIVGSDAEPGVPASDRTLAVATGRTAWDLDVTSPHPSTASPPRDTTSGSGDPDGCADGSEDRADHASSPAGAARKQSPAPSYAASDRTNDAAPPNDADGDIDYTAAVKNIAHRYASRVAENTCAAKLAEAEAELSLLELREDGFAQWLSDYKTAADTNASRYSSYRRTPQQSGSGLAILRFNDYEANKATYAALLAARYTNLSSALAAAKTAYDATTDRTAGSSRAAVIAGGNSGCAAHYDSEITRLKTLFSTAETSASGNGAAGIKEEQNAVTQTRLVSPPAVSVTTTVNSYSVPDVSAVESRRESRTICLDVTMFGGCRRSPLPGETCGNNCPGRTRVEVTIYYTCPGGRYTVSGTVSGTYKTARRSSSFSATYAAASRGESTSSACPGFAVQSGATYASGAAAYVRGTPGTASGLPSAATASAPGTLRALSKVSLLGSYYLSHGDRANLEASSADDRNAAGSSLSVTAGSVPSGSPQEIAVFKTAYKTAYDTAFSQAEGHMSGTAWNNFDWRYETSTLAWGGYQEDPATTYSASTATPQDGTGCDLVNVASDGTVSVEATRLDYETSSYGKGSVYGTRTDAQRTCKIRRTRTPELVLKYQPSRPSGTDASKTATFWHVDYQPTAAERFKLYDEAEVFAVKASLADSPPVLCYQPGEALVAHVAAKGIDAVNKAVFRHASGFAGGNKKHCYRHPSAAQLGTPPQPAFAFFDDTAHSAMASVSVVWQQPTPKIVSKLGSEDDLKMMANTVNLVASAPVAYDDATRTSSFYGTYYTFPTDTSVNSPSGWDITGHPSLTLASTFTQHQVQAKDTAAKTPTTHTMVFKFIDCVFGIEDVAFVDNIASPYALLSDENGVVPSGWKQTYDSDPHNSPTWYYPAFSTYEGALRLVRVFLL